MDKQNYRESLEKDRQEISVNSSTGLTRRAQRHTLNQKSKKRKNILLPALFFIFILIPVTILIYVAFLYEPDDTLKSAAGENEVSVETNSPSNESPLVPAEEKEEETEKEEPAEEEQPAKEETQETAVPEESEKEVQAEEPETEAIAEEQEQPVEQPVEEPAEQPEAQQQSQKTVTVQENETLYRIAVNNYGASGAGAAVEKIKQANGLSSNEISVGQTLILP